MGIATDIKKGTPNILADKKGKEWHEGFKKGGKSAGETAFIGYEWTSIPKGFNLHRNVIFRDNADKALKVEPLATQPPLGTTDPLALYKWLENYENKTGGRAFAFAHNGNLSNGWMFPTAETYAGGVVDEEYVKLRAKWEPHYEITQI
jgi:hypothetical protein